VQKGGSKLLGKINYLRHFIINLAGKVDSFLPMVGSNTKEILHGGQSKRKHLNESKDT
jgi:hypothetical protein